MMDVFKPAVDLPGLPAEPDEKFEQFPPEHWAVPTTTNVTPAEPQAKRTFLDLLSQLAGADDELADPNFDPAKLVEDIRGKVDGLNSILIRMDAVAAFLKEMAKPLTAKASTLGNNYERLRAYVAATMVLNKFDSVPGEAWKVRLRESNPALHIPRACTPQDALDFPEWVRVDRVYSWENAKIKAALVAGEKVPEEIGAAVTVGVWPEWVPNVPAALERKKKPRKKKGAVDAAVVAE